MARFYCVFLYGCLLFLREDCSVFESFCVMKKSVYSRSTENARPSFASKLIRAKGKVKTVLHSTTGVELVKECTQCARLLGVSVHEEF
jgi:hypothetical protein